MRALLGLLGVISIWASPGRHDLHVSYSRLVLDGRTVACRIRLFHDDLQLALRAAGGRPDLRLTDTDRADSLFSGYFQSHVRMLGDGTPIALHVTASGMEPDAAAQQIVWYVLEGTVGDSVQRLTILNGVLFDAFADQQNIVQLLRLPGERRQTFYFTASDPREQRLVIGH